MSKKEQIRRSLEELAFDLEYIRRGIRIYEKNYRNHDYNIDLMIEIIFRLQNKDENKRKLIESQQPHQSLEFIANMTVHESSKLRVNDKIDHRDPVGRFVFASIVEKQGTKLKVHYDGWSRKWDVWSDYLQEIYRFAKAGSISKRPAHRFKHLKQGDFVDLNPSNRHPGWTHGEIRRLDQNSGQVQVVYESDQKNYLYWAHLDNKDEIAEFTSKSRSDEEKQISLEREVVSKEKPSSEVDLDKINSKASNNSINNDQNNGQNYGSKSSSELPSVINEDPMEIFQRLRCKRFPREANERIDNLYGIGDRLQILDQNSRQWNPATITDKENNWIVVHFDGLSSRWDYKIHVIEEKNLIRELGPGEKINKNEIEIEKEGEGENENENELENEFENEGKNIISILKT